MKRLSMLLVAAISIGPAMAQVQAPAPAASAPPPIDQRLHSTPASENPTVRASKQATIPGENRPQRQTVQQIRIPIGKPAGSSTGGGIDDSVARCRAKVTSEAREACEAGLDH